MGNKNSEEDYRMGSHRSEIQRTSENGWGDEVLNALKKLTVNNWTCLVKDRKTWYKLVQEAKTHKGNSVREEEEGIITIDMNTLLLLLPPPPPGNPVLSVSNLVVFYA
jgi:hypothetical protein